MKNRPTKTWVEISRKALRHNIQVFRRHIGRSVSLMAVVKSNAYGHGLERIAGIADNAGADWFAVDSVDEGMRLRKAGIRRPILILGYTLRNRLEDCVRSRLSFVVYNKETVQTLKKLNLKKNKAFVHIKIETGTNRQGVEGEELRRLVQELKKIPGIIIEGVSTHFANIEDASDHSYAYSQMDRFVEGLRILREEGIDPLYKHVACSAAAFLFKKTHFSAIRLGISLYGLWSSPSTMNKVHVQNKKLTLQPVLSWKTIVAQVKEVKKGSSIGYGLTERVMRDSKIAILPIGYWDGYDRKLSSIGHVLIKGRRCKILGRICMNMCMVDITDVPRVHVEDEVVLLGVQGKEMITAEEIAAKVGTIHYEIVTRINPLIQRIIV